MRTVFVINGNSSETITACIDAAIDPLRSADGPAIECVTLAEAPPGIQSQRDSDLVVGPLLRLAATLEAKAAAFVIACFSDPGLHALREQSRRPVFGISECAVHTALSMGQSIGVMTTRQSSVPRLRRYMRSMGIDHLVAGALSLDLAIPDLMRMEISLPRMIATGQRLRDEHGADVLILGGAPMAPNRAGVEAAVGLPVIDPNQAAVAIAVARARILQAAEARQ